MVRSIFGVLIGLVTFMVASLLTTIGITSSQSWRYVSQMGANLSGVALTFCAGCIGGYTTASIGRSAKAVPALIIIVATGFVLLVPASIEDGVEGLLWLVAFGIAGCLGIFAGGRMRRSQTG